MATARASLVAGKAVIWCVMALKAARTAGLKVDGKGFVGLKKWLDDAQGENGMYAYNGIVGWDRMKKTTRVVIDKCFSSPCMCASALMGRLWTETPSDDPNARKTAEIVVKAIESGAAAGPDLYFLHHGSIAMFQMGDEHWKRWNKVMKPVVLKSQAADGSWTGTGYTQWTPMSTALGALVLESYYRYSPLYR